MSVADTLALWGILRPEITIRAAQTAGLELAAACVIVVGESGGGRMVYGSDGAPTAPRSDAQGVIYQFGGPVTEANYCRYRAAQQAGLIPRQGLGDVQLTSEEFVARAEQIGPGPWDPYCNQLAGFIGLAERIRKYGTRSGFRAYNGSGPLAEAYADRAMVALTAWRDRIGATDPIPAPTPPPIAELPLPREDTPMAPIPITPGADGVFRASVMVEAGASSLVVDRAWLTVGSTWGGSHFRVCALDNTGAVMPGWLDIDVANNRRAVLEIPSGAVMATIEGHRGSNSSIPTAALVVLAK